MSKRTKSLAVVFSSIIQYLTQRLCISAQIILLEDEWWSYSQCAPLTKSHASFCKYELPAEVLRFSWTRRVWCLAHFPLCFVPLKFHRCLKHFVEHTWAFRSGLLLHGPVSRESRIHWSCCFPKHKSRELSTTSPESLSKSTTPQLGIEQDIDDSFSRINKFSPCAVCKSNERNSF